MFKLKKKDFVYIFLSFFIIIHLFVIIIYPNTSSYIWSIANQFLRPYGSTLGVGATWKFYAPNPEIGTHLEIFTTLKGVEENVIDPTNFRWPPEKTGIFDLSYTRKKASSKFVEMRSEWASLIFVPWICRQNINIESVVIKKVTVKLPSLKEVQDGGKLYDTNQNMTEELAFNTCEDALNIFEEDKK